MDRFYFNKLYRFYYNALYKAIEPYLEKYFYIGLEAFSNMPDKVLHVIGSGREKFIDKYDSMPNIIFLGQLSHNKVIGEMEAGKALIFASRCYEGMPMTIIEAYKSKLLVISCDVGNAKELVINSTTGLHFNSGNVESLTFTVKQMENIIVDQLRINARIEFENKYSDVRCYRIY